MPEVRFKKVDYTLRKLVEDIDMGEIGLPDIQRPFVWPPAKVRDLFDSMYRGYPIGYLLFWENGNTEQQRPIGAEPKQKVARLVVVDGQQRLTSLYAVTKARLVLDKNFRNRRIRIAFHPREEKFEVTNPAIEQDVEWISDIGELWKPGTSTFAFVKRFIERLRKVREVPDEEEAHIARAIDRLENLLDYPLTALEVSSSTPEKDVADIFVRINSQGTPLKQADFILTLMSVFWDEGRARLEEFCRQATSPPSDNRPSPFNHYLEPGPDQLLRVAVALGFRRAELEHVYSLLRGKDLETRKFSEEQRERQFAILREAQAYALDLQNWHEFFKVLKRAGYPSGQLVTSEVAILYTYALWLLGKRDFRMDPYELRELMARWFFMVSLTARYTGSPEARMEQDLALLRSARTAEEFRDTLEREIEAVLTSDYWTVTLPNELATATARSTGQFAYYAALCLLGARALFSKLKVAELLEPSTRAKKTAIERHHLFPRRYLEKTGIRERRLQNQVANYALVEWSDNVAISDRSPREYVPKLEERFSPEELRQMYEWHALPERWYEMDYLDFLAERRRRIAAIVRRGFEQLGGKGRAGLGGH